MTYMTSIILNESRCMRYIRYMSILIEVCEYMTYMIMNESNHSKKLSIFYRKEIGLFFRLVDVRPKMSG